MGFFLDDSYTFQLCLGFHPLVGMLRKQVLLFSMNFQVLIKLYNASGTSCLISYRKYGKQCIPWLGTHTDVMHCNIICVVVQLFILGLNFILLCLKSTIIHFHTPKQRNIKLKPRIKLNHNIWPVLYKYDLRKSFFVVFFLNLGIRWSVRRRSSSYMHSGSFQRIPGKKAVCAASVR